MTLKLIMQWDIKPGKDQEYIEFILKEWIPTTSAMGMRTIGAWYSIYTCDDDAPRLMAEALIDDRQTVHDILDSDAWTVVQERLMTYVDNYSHKIVYATGYFQL